MREWQRSLVFCEIGLIVQNCDKGRLSKNVKYALLLIKVLLLYYLLKRSGSQYLSFGDPQYRILQNLASLILQSETQVLATQN